MDLAPLQLSDYFVIAINVEAQSDYAPSAPDEFDVETLEKLLVDAKCIPDEKTENRFTVTLTIKQDRIEGKNLPYVFELRMVGFLDFLAKDWEQGEIQRQIEINGPSMLFGAAREILRAATGRGPFGPVLLPSTTFFKERSKPKSSKKKSTLAPKHSTSKHPKNKRNKKEPAQD